VSVGKCCCC